MEFARGKLIGWSLPLAAAAVVAAFAPALAGETIRGRSRVVDGDTIIIRKIRIGLFGIDAPEYRQKCSLDGRPWSCGISAKAVLKSAIGTKLVSCKLMPIAGAGPARRAGVCRAGRLELNQWMVVKGWAMAVEAPVGGYVLAENTAREKRRGIWAGTFLKPSAWRQQRQK
ncbi:MAG: thermonuclease family protein [Rhodospirillaceae bacterium]|nr:thermonuclease family protein [Rhodospirillaceae bacterium]